MNVKTVLVGAIATAAMVAGCGSASAKQTAFTDTSAFIAASGPLTFESFENATSTTSVPPFGRDNFTEVTFANTDVTCAAPSCVITYSGTFPDDGVADVGAYSQQGITFSFATPIKAFGIDTIGAGTASFPTDISFTTANGSTTILTSVFQNYFNAVLFAGLTDTAGFTSLSIYGTDASDFVEFDSLRFSSTLAGGVPEPTSWLLMIVGLAAVGAGLRRPVAKPAGRRC